MSTWRFDHLGLVVAEIGPGREFVSAAMGLTHWSQVFEDRGLGVSVQFGRGDSGPCFELIAPLGDGSPVRGALRGEKNVLNHVAYLTEDIAAEGQRLRALGCHPTGEPKPAVAYAGRLVQFWVSPLRFIMEIIEAPEHEHLFLPTQP